MSLDNLAAHLATRYKPFRGVDDLNETIVLDRDALFLCPPGHPDRSMSLNNLSHNLSTMYKRLEQIADINDAIVLPRDARRFAH